jgi:hypothetical protein
MEVIIFFPYGIPVEINFNQLFGNLNECGSGNGPISICWLSGSGSTKHRSAYTLPENNHAKLSHQK